jgi:hypothetical protein
VSVKSPALIVLVPEGSAALACDPQASAKAANKNAVVHVMQDRMGIEELLLREVNRERRCGTSAFSGIDRPNANATAQRKGSTVNGLERAC